ncbi:nitroreductase/quinone reductase family protein [Nocardia sp. NPDC051787]|uniref:nitroreductase/quinone reductase family protein n=1 Tax=Nocardia sp. NPDC051787 TaxID=3155415 RepID=UPI003418C694
MAEITGYRTSGWAASAMLTALHAPITRRLARGLTELRYQARRTHRRIALPVSYARDGKQVVVRVGHAETKSWWRNFTTPGQVSVWVDGRWQTGTARVVEPGTGEYADVWAIYPRRFPRIPASGTDPMVVTELDPAQNREHTATASGKRLWRRWFATVTLGELLGFAVPAVAAVLVREAAEAVAVAVLLAAGAVEGTVLGWFQARVLHAVVPGLPRRDWITATAAGALVAWLSGVGLVVSDGFKGWPPLLVVPTAAAAGVVMVLSLGVAQWFVLRNHLTGAGSWGAATALGWVAALAVFTLFTTPLWQPEQPGALTAAIGIGGGLLMASVMAAVTGTYLVWLLRAQPHAQLS